MRCVRAASICFAFAVSLGACGKKSKKANDDWTPPTPEVPATASVWVVDDSVRVGKRDGARPILAGTDNPVWSPGKAVSLFGLPGETIAIQVGVTAGPTALSKVYVQLEQLSGPGTIANEGTAPWKPIERFVVHDVTIERRSGGKVAGESLGWYKGAQPPDEGNRGGVPDPLIPIEHAVEWADYPMTVASGEHRIVWIDLTLDDDLASGTYRGEILVNANTAELARYPVELVVGRTKLPYAAAPTMLFHDPDMVRGRVGHDLAEPHYLQLIHRHHITPFFNIKSAADVAARRAQLTGELFTSRHGYNGPGAGVGQDVIALGTYGSLGDPGPEPLADVEQAVAALKAGGFLDRDVFIYAIDEQCESDRAPRWRALLDASDDANVRTLLVGHTCSEPPASQPVDLAIVFSSSFDPKKRDQAVAKGKRVWVYNGMLPRVGSYLTDGDPMSLRANPWLQTLYDIERWFYWESVFWGDGNNGGLGPYDPWSTAETFHNQHGDHCNGDGVLVYPGDQPGFDGKSLGFQGVVPSFRLKQWRRGIQDAGYLELARAIDREKADAIARALIGKGFSDVDTKGEPTWPRDGAKWTEARRKLFDMIEGR
jgi:hypothetical protein